MSPNPLKPYYGLRMTSGLYKALAVLVIIVALGALGSATYSALSSRGTAAADFQMWLSQVLPIVAGSGLTSLTLYVISQLIDVQLDQTRAINLVSQKLDEQNELLHALKDSNEIRTAVSSELLARQTRLAATSTASQATP